LKKKIVEAHNGRMWITSKLNQGTTFHFTLPVKQPAAGGLSDTSKKGKK